MLRNRQPSARTERRIEITWVSADPFQPALRVAARSGQPDTRRLRIRGRPGKRGPRFVLTALLPLAVILAAILLTAGCTAPTARSQRLVSRPNMLFSDSAAMTYNAARLLPQLEPGSAASGGAQNAGCTACR